MKLERIKGFKEQLSKALLVPEGIDYVFGVGIGIQRNCDHLQEQVIGLAGHHLRIYGTNNPELKLFETIRDLFNLSFLPASFPIELKANNETTQIKFIKAPRPTLATNTTANETADKCSDFIDEDQNEIKAGCRIKLGQGSTGTLGFFCRLKTNNTKIFLLSNSHVIAAYGEAAPDVNDIWYGENEIGILDRDSTRFGKYLIRFGEDSSKMPKKYFTHKMDAAIAALINFKPTSVIRMPKGKTITISGSYPMDSSGRTDPSYSYRVTKHGYGSCQKGGWIDDIDCDFLMNKPGLSNDLALFVNQFRIARTIKPNVDGIDNQYTFGTNGDSGSLVFDNNKTTNTHKAIGLFFAFGTEGEGKKDFMVYDPKKPKSLSNCYSVVTPISVIEDELGIELIYPKKKKISSS